MCTVDIYRVTFLVVIAIIIKYLRFGSINFYSTPIKKMFFYTFESQYTHVYLIFQILFGYISTYKFQIIGLVYRNFATKVPLHCSFFTYNS